MRTRRNRIRWRTPVLILPLPEAARATLAVDLGFFRLGGLGLGVGLLHVLVGFLNAAVIPSSVASTVWK